MRLAAACVVVCGLVAEARAGEANGAAETLVGWSEDGGRYAITGFDTRKGEFFLEVRDGDKPVAHWTEGDKLPAVDRIDVETWGPIKKFGLKKLDAGARKKFAAELAVGSTTKTIDRYHCKSGGWSIKHRGKVVREAKAETDHCLDVLGGYVSRSGTRALVKVREAWQLPASQTGGEKVTEERLTFVMIELPASP